MFEAALTDVLRDDRFDVTALVSEAVPFRPPAGVRVRTVPPGADREALVAEAAAADVTLVVAPETDGLLADRVAAVRAVGGHPLACEAAFLETAADKQATVTALAAAGVPVAAGRLLAPGEPWPTGFRIPAVAKPRAGAGCDGFVVVGPGDPPPVSALPLRIETFIPGTPVGVSCLCGPRGVHPLPPLRQLFSAGPSPRYLGAAAVGDAACSRRACDLARRAITAVAWACGGAARGWVGVDMILGDRADGTDDRVLEVNPRLTTSFATHARGRSTSLLAAAIRVAAGGPAEVAAETPPRRVVEVACP